MKHRVEVSAEVMSIVENNPGITAEEIQQQIKIKSRKEVVDLLDAMHEAGLIRAVNYNAQKTARRYVAPKGYKLVNNESTD